MRIHPGAAGFTLIEAVVVMAVTGIIAAVAAVFIAGPVDSYFESAHRAELTDAADTALRRMARDLRLAVPNSVRVTVRDGVSFLEFIPSLSGGQYRENENCFKDAVGCNQITLTHGSLPNLAAGAVNGNFLVIYNLDNNADGDCGDAIPSVYCGDNIAAITANGTVNDATYGSLEMTLAFGNGGANTIFQPSLGSSPPSQRFQVATGPVSYVCAPAAGGGGTLTRFWGYPLQAGQPTLFTAGNRAALVGNVSGCSITYNDAVLGNRGLVTLWLRIQRGEESVSLMQQVHVDNSA